MGDVPSSSIFVYTPVPYESGIGRAIGGRPEG
jgi:hypothetical protein